jgi:hypothetical protein
MMNAFISMLMFVDMHYYFLQSCVNIVFRHEWGPPSFRFIYLAIILHWLVRKLCNADNFSCTISYYYSRDKHGVLTLVNKSLWQGKRLATTL